MISTHQTSRSSHFRPVLWIGIGLVIGSLFGSTINVSPAVRAEVTESPRRETFKDGGVMNESVLREISATLKRIETRVDRIEKNTAPAPQNAGNPALQNAGKK